MDIQRQLPSAGSFVQKTIPSEVRQAYAESAQYFPTALQQFQFFDKYSRFDYSKARRETWLETVTRAVDYLKELSQNKLPETDYQRIHKAILEMKATPSMRLLAMAGDAAKRQNICIYNCSYLPVDAIDSWVEALIISMSGCGVGFSVERQYVDLLPEVKVQTGEKLPTLIVEDTTEGWASALRVALTAWFNGQDLDFDFSLIREAGSPLKVKGGRASGPEPLKKMLEFARSRILARAGGKIKPIDAHDIMCEVGNAAVSGGMRRTAMISLFDRNDEEMRHAKDPGFELENSQRWNANNSTVWTEDTTDAEVELQMREMISGMRGEPGIFSRYAANTIKPERRKEADFGTNPCGEINLRPYEFCNLTIAIARPEDTIESLKEKVEIASIIGTIQSMATYFPGLRDIWRKNCQEERLLGVDINGQKDCPAVQSAEVMDMLREHSVETNKKYAQILGINQSAAVTCVKPGGNSSQLFNTSNGLHARHYPYYIRNVRLSSHSPIFKVLRDAGVPLNPENAQGQADWDKARELYEQTGDIVAAKSACHIFSPISEWSEDKVKTWVASFPVATPKGAKTVSDVSVLEQCEYWLLNKLHWTEHNPSVTIMYRDHEVEEMIKWVVEHKNLIGGMSFLPHFDAKYPQLPYMEISEEQYYEMASKFPEVDFSRIYLYEDEDLTTAAQELACVSGVCEIPTYEMGLDKNGQAFASS